MNGATNIIEDLRLLEPWSPWLAAGLLAGLLILGAMAFFLWRRRRALRAAPFSPEVAAHAHEDALAALARAHALIGAGQARAYSIEVSGIVRRYLERRFNLVAPRRSTEEFLVEAATSPQLEPRHQELLREFLGACDFLKFARGRATGPELESMHQAAVRFVTDTRVAPGPEGVR